MCVVLFCLVWCVLHLHQIPHTFKTLSIAQTTTTTSTTFDPPTFFKRKKVNHAHAQPDSDFESDALTKSDALTLGQRKQEEEGKQQKRNAPLLVLQELQSHHNRHSFIRSFVRSFSSFSLVYLTFFITLFLLSCILLLNFFFLFYNNLN